MFLSTPKIELCFACPLYENIQKGPTSENIEKCAAKKNMPLAPNLKVPIGKKRA